MLSGSRNTSTDAYSLVGDRRLGQGLVGDIGAENTLRFEVSLPGLEIGTAADHEASVVEARDSFTEHRAGAGVVTVQHDHELAVVVGEEFADPAGVRHVHPELDAEDVLVPSDARVDVGDCQRKVV